MIEPVLIQEACLLDARTIPEYVREMRIYRRCSGIVPFAHINLDRAMDERNASPFDDEAYRDHNPMFFLQLDSIRDPNGIPNFKSEYVSIDDIQAIMAFERVGAAFYPKAVDYLARRLGIRGVRNIRNATSPGIIRHACNVKSLRQLLESAGGISPVFELAVKPEIDLGTNTVDVMMSYLSVNSGRTTIIMTDNDEETPGHETAEQRNIVIGNIYRSAESARNGLRGLMSMYEETTVDEMLLALVLPEEIGGLYGQARKIAYELIMTGFSRDFDEAFQHPDYINAFNTALFRHLQFVAPYFQSLGLDTKEVRLHNPAENSGMFVPVYELGEVIEEIRNDATRARFIPTIICEYNGTGQSVSVEINPECKLYDPTDYAFGIKGGNAALMELFEAMQSIPNP